MSTEPGMERSRKETWSASSQASSAAATPFYSPSSSVSGPSRQHSSSSFHTSQSLHFSAAPLAAEGTSEGASQPSRHTGQSAGGSASLAWQTLALDGSAPFSQDASESGQKAGEELSQKLQSAGLAGWLEDSAKAAQRFQQTGSAADRASLLLHVHKLKQALDESRLLDLAQLSLNEQACVPVPAVASQPPTLESSSPEAQHAQESSSGIEARSDSGTPGEAVRGDCCSSSASMLSAKSLQTQSCQQPSTAGNESASSLESAVLQRDLAELGVSDASPASTSTSGKGPVPSNVLYGFESPLPPEPRDKDAWYISSSGRVRAAAVAGSEEECGSPSASKLCFDARECFSVGLTPHSAVANRSGNSACIAAAQEGRDDNPLSPTALMNKFCEAAPDDPASSSNSAAPNPLDGTSAGARSCVSEWAASDASSPLPQLSPDQLFADALGESPYAEAASGMVGVSQEAAAEVPFPEEDISASRRLAVNATEGAASRGPASPSPAHLPDQVATVVEILAAGDLVAGQESICVHLSSSDGSPVVSQSVLRTGRKGRFVLDDDDDDKSLAFRPAASGSELREADGGQKPACSSAQASPAFAQIMLQSSQSRRVLDEGEGLPAAIQPAGSHIQLSCSLQAQGSAGAAKGGGESIASPEPAASPDSPVVTQSTLRKGRRRPFMMADDSDSEQDPSAFQTPARCSTSATNASDTDEMDEDAADLEGSLDFSLGCTPTNDQDGGSAAHDSPFSTILLSSDSDGEGDECILATGARSNRRSRIVDSDSEAEDSPDKENTGPATPVVPHTSARGHKPQGAIPGRAPKTAPPGPRRSSLLAPKIPMTAAAFRRQRAALATNLFREYNDRVFGGRLPGNLEITWNANLRTTAGLAYYKREVSEDGKDHRYTSRVELSSKVVDSADKLKSTLLHELCHVAAWTINHVAKPPHGAHFKYWAGQAMRAYPGKLQTCAFADDALNTAAACVDLNVATCHSYAIHYPFQWQCTNTWCGRIVKRHSNSVDVERQACGSCKGRLKFLGRFNADGTPAAKRGPSHFSLFVRDNFSAVKQAFPAGTPHAAVMRSLAERWREQKAAGKESEAEDAEAAVRRLDLSDDAC